MKNLFTTMLLLLLSYVVQAQYFQQHFNLDYSSPKLRSERLNSGIFTNVNFLNSPPNYYYAGIGTSYNNTLLAAPDSVADRMRFIQLGVKGLTVFGNYGYQFADSGELWFNPSGNSIAEVDDSAGTGGYVAVGAIANNNITHATNIPGGSDMLFAQLDSTGAVVTARRIDIANGADTAWCIRRSVIRFNNQPTWIVCGSTRRNLNLTDCFVMRVRADGTIVWARRFNFDPGGGAFNSARCVAKQLCEGTNGNIYVVGTLQDNMGVNGIDGLAFALMPNGNLLWANNYQLGTDDEFQAVRFTAAGNLIVGGFTNFGAVAPVTHHMLITELATANGAVLFQNVLEASNGAVTYTSKCYDIAETIVAGVTNYFLAGPLITPTGTYEMMYRTNAVGLGINWYSYNNMVYNTGFGIDNAGTIKRTGIAYFSSVRDSLNSGFSDSHIMKTDYNGRTCLYCNANPPYNLNIQMIRYSREHRHNNTGAYRLLLWKTFDYNNQLTCNDASITCGNQSASSVTQDQSVSAKSAAAIAFPNPVHDVLHVQLNNLKQGHFEMLLTATDGKIVLQKNCVYANSKTYMDIDVSSITPGIYILAIKQNEKVIQQKIIKE